MKRRAVHQPSRGKDIAEDRKIHNIPVSLGKPSLRIRLEAYYSAVAPGIISDQSEWRAKLDQIYAKFGGTHEGEAKLSVKLTKKYGTGVRLVLAANDGRNNVKAPSASVDPSKVHSEEWYQLRPREMGSGNLSFLSDCFDPLAALQASEAHVQKVNPFLSDCSRLDTVGKFVVHLTVKDPLRKDPVTRKRATPAENADPKLEEPHKKQKSVGPFEAVSDMYATGPLLMLHQSIHKRVRVLVRYVNGIRGTVTGNLVTFDKHMNMILTNVEEVYSPRYVSDEAENPLSNVEQEMERRKRALRECNGETMDSWCVRTRQMKQMLLRGDCVVLVYKAEEERSAWPVTSMSPKGSIYKCPTKTVPPEDRIGSPGSLIFAVRRSQRASQRKSDKTDYKSTPT